MLYLHPGPDSVLWSQVCKVRHLGWWNQVQVHLPKPPYEWGLPTWPSRPIGSHIAEHLGHGCLVVISCRQRAWRPHRPQSWAQRQREQNPVPHASGSRRRYICSYVVPFHSVLAHSQFRVKDSQGVSNHADNPLFVMSPMSLWMSPMMPPHLPQEAPSTPSVSEVQTLRYMSLQSWPCNWETTRTSSKEAEIPRQDDQLWSGLWSHQRGAETENLVEKTTLHRRTGQRIPEEVTCRPTIPTL